LIVNLQTEKLLESWENLWDSELCWPYQVTSSFQ